MTTFITAGSSHTGLTLAKRMRASEHPVLLGSRSKGRGIPSELPWITFDWHDPTTFSNPFESNPSATSKIDSIFFVVPNELDPLPRVAPFVDLAIEKGVKRFVVAGSADVPKGEVDIGKVHEYLEEKGVEFVVLRPTWFIDNLARTQLENIQDNDEILTPVPTGRIPFIAVEDIVEVAIDALTRPSPIPRPGEDYEGATAPVIIGPELLSYNKVAEILSEVLGRSITHRVISEDEVLQQYEGFGIPKDSEVAQWLLKLELGLEKGSAERLVQLDDAKKRVGKVTLREWVEKNKSVWQKVSG